MPETTEEIIRRVFEREAKPVFMAIEMDMQKEKSERAALDVRLEEAMSAKDELKGQCDKHVETLEAKDVELANLRKEMNVFKKTLEDKAVELANEQKHKESLQGELGAVKEHRDSVVVQLDESRRSYAEQEKSLEASSELLEAEKGKNIALSKQIETHETDYAIVEGQKNKLSTDIETLETNLALANSQKKELSSTLTDLQREHNKLLITFAQKEQEINKLQQEAGSRSDKKGKRTATPTVVQEGGASSKQEEDFMLVLGSDDEFHEVKASKAITPAKRKSSDMDIKPQRTPAPADKEPAPLIRPISESEINSQGVSNKGGSSAGGWMGGSSNSTGKKKTQKSAEMTPKNAPISGNFASKSKSSPGASMQQSTAGKYVVPIKHGGGKRMKVLQQKLKPEPNAGGADNVGYDAAEEDENDPNLDLCSKCEEDTTETPNLPAVPCDMCPRSYHIKCLIGLDPKVRAGTVPEDLGDPWLCPVCDALKGEAERFHIEKTATLQDIVKDLTAKMQKHEFAASFLDHVDIETFPDYKTFVYEPMDLGLAYNMYTLNLPQGADRTARVHDSVCKYMKNIQLVFKNCRAYNEKNAAVYRCSQHLEDMVIQAYKDHIANELTEEYRHKVEKCLGITAACAQQGSDRKHKKAKHT